MAIYFGGKKLPVAGDLEAISYGADTIFRRHYPEGTVLYKSKRADGDVLAHIYATDPVGYQLTGAYDRIKTGVVVTISSTAYTDNYLYSSSDTRLKLTKILIPLGQRTQYTAYYYYATGITGKFYFQVVNNPDGTMTLNPTNSLNTTGSWLFDDENGSQFIAVKSVVSY
ncbi:MAG TPA: hypothetical protein H9875_00365 [Candidatus Levilactobacillus faecigallinarum]|uniref:Uncharacterized protein n=1 Tax=Candidatus Levilactobacillus faecigallinarum TaxID=2838638 RepID=A0A9D1QQF3_9LACO|nr:hypothetical protein [Candidatus Levilactobacillus faecigallinarum]